MGTAFINLLNLSITASYLVLAIILLRLIFKKAPKWLSCLLWGLVAIRLVFPFSVESFLSLIPSTAKIPEAIIYNTEPTFVTNTIPIVNYDIVQSTTQQVQNGVIHASINFDAWGKIWLCGACAMLLYALISYFVIAKKTRASIETEKGIYICDDVPTPFILGIIKPKIILPSVMDKNNVSYVVAHEKAHLKRLDHFWKPLGFALLSVYWFNPIMWVAYILFCRDIELACDERVIRDMGNEDKKAYSSALLSCSMPRKLITACPLAFGEVGVKERIKGVLNYKKPAFWIIIAAVIASVAVAVCFLTDPADNSSKDITLEDVMSSPFSSSQKNVNVVLTIPKDALPDDIYSEEGHTFEKEEVIAFAGKTTTIYLTSIKFANEGSDKLYFNFNCSYNLPRSGTVLLPYAKTSATQVANIIKLDSHDLEHSSGIVENAVTLRVQGPNEQFAFYIDTEACKAATGTIRICTVMNAYTYYAPEDNPNLSFNTSPTSNTAEPASTSVSFIDDDFENEFAISKAFVFAGVTVNYELFYEALNADKQGLYGYEFLPIHKLESVSDISAFKDKFSDFQFSHTLDLPQFDDIAVEYNDEFFKDNILLITHVVTQGVGNCLINTGNVSKENVVFYIEKEEEKNSDALYGWLLCIGVNRRFIDSDTQFDAVVINEGSILGTWVTPASVVGLNVSEIPENARAYYAFYADGTGAEWNDINADVAHVFADMYRREFAYAVENGILTITYLNDSNLADDDFKQFRYNVSGTRLTLSDINANRILELTRFIGEPMYN